ncbi:hypothetical protein CYMTET_55229 [Cymbomonas tetramitiformis]|uniref:Uncharacterized protein n=1 Tax=Cymbomonas tetramitiformis TaxID=36881 RepID=A0AAE0BFG2_9CHLO|nr:hypothetical protein CYMTET_55229 [Cymbomonas tetramitiformis]
MVCEEHSRRVRVANNSVLIAMAPSLSEMRVKEVGGYTGDVGEYTGDVGEYAGDVGEFPGDVGEYLGEVGEYNGDVGTYPSCDDLRREPEWSL